MSNSASLLAYPDVKEAMDKALISERGVKVAHKTIREAVRFLGRCNSFRVLDRKENLKIYLEPAHSLHGRSVYDVLSLTRQGDVVFIVPIKINESAVEFL